MEQYLMEILTAIIGLAIIFIAPYIKKFLTAIETKIIQELGVKDEEAIKAYVFNVVKTIYQKYYTLDNIKKFSKAAELIEQKYGLDILSADEIEVLIESAYVDLKKELGLLDTITPIQKAGVEPVIGSDDEKPTPIKPV